MTPHISHATGHSLWRCFENILREIRYYMTMFTRFVRRVFGLDESRRSIDDRVRDIHECESQSSVTASDSGNSVVSVSNLNMRSYSQDDYRIECTVDVHNIDTSQPPNMPGSVMSEPAQPLSETTMDTTLTPVVNLEVNDYTRDVRRHCECLVLESTDDDLTDYQLTERVRTVFEEVMLAIEHQKRELFKGEVGEPKSEHEKTLAVLDHFSRITTQKQFDQWLREKRHADNSSIPLPERDQSQPSLPLNTNHQGLEASAATNSDDADNEHDRVSTVDDIDNSECRSCHQPMYSTARDVFDFKAIGPLSKTNKAKSETVKSSSPCNCNSPPGKKSKTQKHRSPSPYVGLHTLKDMVLTNAPRTEVFRESAKNMFDIQNDLHMKQKRKNKPNLPKTENTEPIVPKDPNASAYINQVFPYSEHKVVTLKHKYTYTLETYDTLSKCRIIKPTSGLLTIALINSNISAVDDQWRLEESMVNKSFQTDRDPSLQPHFDLACLFASNQPFLYETSSGFERAAYRMDGGQIAPRQGRKGRKFQKPENKKVKRRGIPNKHLAPKEQTYVHTDKGQGEEEKMLEPEVHKEEVMKPEIVGKRGNGDSPRLDLRHFEVVPIAVVQKKKMEDDIEIQYAVDVGQKRKNKNKKKQCKTPVKENKDCEDIRNMILGCNTSRSGDNSRGRRHSGDL